MFRPRIVWSRSWVNAEEVADVLDAGAGGEIARGGVHSRTPRSRVDTFNGLLVDYVERKARRRSSSAGCGRLSDFEFEFQMALMNQRLQAGRIETRGS